MNFIQRAFPCSLGIYSDDTQRLMILACLRCLKKIPSDVHFGAKYQPLIFLLFKLSSYPSTLIPINWGSLRKVFLKSAFILF